MAMDDARISALTNEVLTALERTGDDRGTESLEARVAALEAEVARLKGNASPPPAAPPRPHISLTVLDVPGGGDRCVLEPDKPCTNTGTCRSFGH